MFILRNQFKKKTSNLIFQIEACTLFYPFRANFKIPSQSNNYNIRKGPENKIWGNTCLAANHPHGLPCNSTVNLFCIWNNIDDEFFFFRCERNWKVFFFFYLFDSEPNVEYFLLKNQCNICCKASLWHVDLDCSKNTPGSMVESWTWGEIKKTTLFLYQ